MMKGTGILLFFVGGIICFSGNAEAHVTNMMTEVDCKSYPLPACPKNLDPVCGSDYITYSNECMLCMARMKSGNNLRVIKKGVC